MIKPFIIFHFSGFQLSFSDADIYTKHRRYSQQSA